MTIQQQALQLHEELQGKLEVVGKCKVENAMDLALAYTPGVAEPCKKIHANKEDAYKYTMKGRTVAVVTDGTAVLGLGDIGPEAALPVMEGKALLFKAFANVDAIPICLDTKDPDKIVEIVKAIAPGFGGINLEDIAAPRCFEIEERLKKELDIPVFHDDQHGTAIVVLAGIINALKLVNKIKEKAQIVVNGAGAAGTAITKLLLSYGFTNILMVDQMGMLYRGAAWMNWSQQEMAKETNPENLQGDLAAAMKNSDVFIGVSAPNIVSKDMIASMNQDAIVFAMANPVPEIMPEFAIEAGARVVGTGRSDFPNQVNNVLAFPGIFKGVLQARAAQITQEMKLAAAEAIASMIPDEELSEVNILPKAFDKGVADQVAEAVISAAKG